MKVWERVLLIFLTLVLLALAAGSMMLVWVDSCDYEVLMFLRTVRGSLLWQVLASVGALLLIFLAVRAAFAGVFSSRKGPLATAVRSTENGGIYVNLETVGSIAERAARKCEAVRELKVRVTVEEHGVAVALKTALAPETVIPDACAEIQNHVKGDVELYCGLNVGRVSVQVDNAMVPVK